MKVSYSKNLKSSYMLIDIEDKYKLDYRTNMLINNSIPGFLRTKGQEDGRGLSLQYDITSKQPLSRIMERGNIKTDELKSLVFDILRSIEESKRFLLEEDDIILDKEFLYVDTASMKVGLVYMPGYNKPIDKQLRGLLLEMPACMASNDPDAVVLAYSLYSESAKEGYVLGDLIKVLSSKKKHDNSEHIKRDAKRELPKEESSIEGAFEYNEIKRKAEKTKNKKGIRLGILDAIKNKSRQKKQDIKANTDIHVPDEFIDSDELWLEEFESDEDKIDDKAEPMTQFLAGAGSSINEHKILRGRQPGLSDIDIAYYPFVIGRQDRISDYIIDREGVSRMHCRIDMEDGAYYIRDLNSRNGTLVNGIALTNDEKIRLNEGDEVQIADMTFQFA